MNYLRVINLLRKNGADTTVKDAFGNGLDYYPNEVQLLSEGERRALLRALHLPISPRPVMYADKDMPQAIKRLRDLNELLQLYGIGQKVRMIIWTLKLVKGISNPHFNIQS